MGEVILKNGGESRRHLFDGRKKYLILLIAAGMMIALYASQKSAALPGGDGGAGTARSGDSNLAGAPARDADVYGMITSVKGNQITVMEFDPSTMPSARQSAANTEDAIGDNAISLGTSSSGMPGGIQGGPPSGFGGDRGGFGGNSTTTRETKLEELKKTGVGMATITVPVGIPIIVSSGAAGAEAGTLKDLSSDTVIVLWMAAKADGTQGTAEYINVTGTVDMTASNPTN